MDTYGIHIPPEDGHKMETTEVQHEVHCEVKHNPPIYVEDSQKDSYHMHEHARAEGVSVGSSNFKENEMGQTDTVHVTNKFEPRDGEGGGMGGLGTAAAIAAMGNRNENSGIAGFLPAMMAMGGRPHDGFAHGGLAAFGGALVGSALFGGRRGGGFLGGGGECEGGNGGAAVVLQQGVQDILVGQGDIKLAVAEQTTSLNSSISQLALGTQMGFANTGDKITNSATALAAQAANQTVQILEAIRSSTAQLAAQANEINTANLNRLLTVADLDRRDERHRADTQEVKSQIVITNTNTANATAIAVARDEEARFRRLEALLVQANQTAIATNANLNIGNTGAVTNAAQTASPVNVRA